jgi:hypothetical protein
LLVKLEHPVDLLRLACTPARKCSTDEVRIGADQLDVKHER